MCGIWISIGLAPLPERLHRVAHRGPDGDGWRVFDSAAGPVALGHRRLAIIDTSSDANQPMVSSDGRHWLTYNGEIYNFVELRAELAQHGVRFRTQSDSEVLIETVKHWGLAGLDKLRGMFAFALWDDAEKVMLVVRDRFGIKPLYFAETRQGIGFGSEIKQLYDLPGLSRRISLPEVRDFLERGILDRGGSTMFEGVQQLRGGELIRIDCRRWKPGQPIEGRRWYHLPMPGGFDSSRASAEEQFRELFKESIRLHLRSDVRLGACLSGGLDSSSIVVEATRQLSGERMTAVCAVFDEPRIDERHYMDAVIQATNADARFVTFSPNRVFDIADRIVWHQDEPFGSSSILAQWFVFEEARRAGVKVMLDGQGADEILGGYHWLFAPHLADLLRTGRLHAAARQVQERKVWHHAAPVGQLLEAAAFLAPEGVRTLARQWRSSGRTKWLHGAFLEASQPRREIAADETLWAPWQPRLPSLLVELTSATSLPMLLHWEDRNSMAHGIEARVPFLDHRLIELALALGSDHKFEGANTKVVLRRALGPSLPQTVVNRTDKIGFATPESEWLQGPLGKTTREAVMATAERFPEIFDRAGTAALLDDKLSGRRPVDFTLWRIACLGIWARRFEMTH